MWKENITKAIKEINKSFLIGLLSLIPISVGFWVFGIFYTYLGHVVSFVYGSNESVMLSIMLFWSVFSLVVLIGLKIRRLEKIFLLSSLESVLSKIPIVGFIINTIKELIKIFYGNGEDDDKYLGVVKAPFNNGRTLGLITANEGDEFTVFIPTAPNPTSGFVMYYKKEELEFLDMKIQEVFKIQLSLGIKQ